MEQNQSGAVRNMLDTRDIQGDNLPVPEAVSPQLPIIDTVTPTLPKMNQNPFGTCPNYDVVRQMQRYWLKKTGKVIKFSPRFFVIQSKIQDNLPKYQGTMPRVVMNLATKMGCCTTDLLPDDTTLSWEEYSSPKAITQAMLDEAAQYRMPPYATYSGDIESLRAALTHCSCVGITLPMGDFSTMRLLPPSLIYPTTPLHRITLYGDVPLGEDNAEFIANQWGASWGWNGDGVFKFSDFKGMIFDVMGFSDLIPQNLVDLARSQNNMDNKNLQIWCAAAKVHEGWFPGSTSWVNSNPGNLRYVGQALATNDPATAGTGPFCHFATYQDGYTTLYNMLFNACTGKSHVYKPTMTLLDFYNLYSPRSDKNDPVAYANFVAQQLGVPVTTQIGSLVA